jgi:hypothetical protein
MSSWSENRSPSDDWTVCAASSVPLGASTSCVVARNWSPARSSVPMTTLSTSASAARALRSGASPAKRAAVALERTTSEPMRAREVAIASGRLNARKSVSGSGRSTRNGRTTSRVSARASAGVSSRDAPGMARSSSAMASAEAGRSAGRLERARRITRSAAATAGEPVKAGGCS